MGCLATGCCQNNRMPVVEVAERADSAWITLKIASEDPLRTRPPNLVNVGLI